MDLWGLRLYSRFLAASPQRRKRTSKVEITTRTGTRVLITKREIITTAITLAPINGITSPIGKDLGSTRAVRIGMHLLGTARGLIVNGLHTTTKYRADVTISWVFGGSAKSGRLVSVCYV